MAYLLGSQAVMESLQSDVLDIQTIVAEVLSRVGPVIAQSWKFPDKSAGDLDIDDLLDLYDCSGESDDVEERQVAHIALYELVIDRLIYCIQALSKFSVTHLGASLANQNIGNTEQVRVAGSVGVIVKEHWAQMTKLQTLYHHLQSESFSKNNKICELEQMLGKTSSQEHGSSQSALSSSNISQMTYTGTQTPGMLGIIPPNTADNILMGLTPPTGELRISKDCYSKNTQTYETAFVACESCDLVQKRMRESGEVVIRVCTEQGLPCSLRKFKNQLSHYESIPYNDLCRWMVEQNKDVIRIGKQIDILQETINPLKADLKGCEKKTRLAEEKAKDSEKMVNEEKEVQSVLRKQLETKLLDQEKKQQEEIWEAERQKQTLQQQLLKQERDVKLVQEQLMEKDELLVELEESCKKINNELKEKTKEVNNCQNQSEELSRLQNEVTQIRGQLEETRKTLVREQGKQKSVSRNNQTLQTKQEGLLFRMETLGQENEELTGQVTILENEKISLEEKLVELKVETKQLRKKSKKNEVIIKNLHKEKGLLEESISETQESLHKLQSQLTEAKERERMIIEYPDLNGPVNSDLQGTGNILEDMSNQVKANTIRISILNQQNEGLTNSIRKLNTMADSGDGETKQSSIERAQVLADKTQASRTVHTPVEPVTLWQSPPVGLEDWKDNNYLTPLEQDLHGPPQVKQHHWTYAEVEEKKSQKEHNLGAKDLTVDFVVGQSNTSSSAKSKIDTKKSKRPSSAKMASVMAPVNATPIGAYTQMKQALGVLSSKKINKQGVQALGIDFVTKKGRPNSSKRHHTSASPVTVPTEVFNVQGHHHDGETPFSCPKCDKMYMKSHELDIHMTYCAS